MLFCASVSSPVPPTPILITVPGKIRLLQQFSTRRRNFAEDPSAAGCSGIFLVSSMASIDLPRCLDQGNDLAFGARTPEHASAANIGPSQGRLHLGQYRMIPISNTVRCCIGRSRRTISLSAVAPVLFGAVRDRRTLVPLLQRSANWPLAASSAPAMPQSPAKKRGVRPTVGIGVVNVVASRSLLLPAVP